MKRNFHYFLAVPINKEQQEIIQNWLKNNMDKLSFKSWVHPEDYHITLAFLGHIETSDQLKMLTELVEDKVLEIKPFKLLLKDIDFFGKKDAPRIFWAGIDHSSPLHYLQKQVVQVCKEIGFSIDSKPFNPHITLARRWKSAEPFIKPEEYNYALQNDTPSFLVRNIHLYKTHLDRKPKYETIEVFPLQGEK